MRTSRFFVASLALALSSLLNFTSCSAADSGVKISEAWVRASAPGQEVGAAYLNLQSNIDSTLTKVESPAAGSVEIHSMTMNNGVMKMRMLETLPLPAGKVVKLEPGSFHLMLFDLKKPLKADESISFVLHFKDGSGKTSNLHVDLPVKTSAN